MLEMAGEIRDLRLQPVYDLHVAGERIGSYVGDFEYFDVTRAERTTEDVKGFKTPLYRWKRKHLKAEYGITILEVTV